LTHTTVIYLKDVSSVLAFRANRREKKQQQHIMCGPRVFCGLADLRWVFCGPTSAARSAKYQLVGPQVRKSAKYPRPNVCSPDSSPVM